ncbi:hypothetical protein IWZ03DRAFT_225353 [Phyllosticta citriasiana]|uniref:F-box domain-containing protein n=1 Tax=Phyllosticta citriasiana TaxID=595635 RepID=A0ABR1KJC2_9PEZI
MTVPKLPPELILSIVDCIRPAAVALPPSDITARTIRSLTLVSRLTYSRALRRLYSHCLWIDSAERLGRLLLTLHALLDPSRQQISTLPKVDVLPCLQSLFLSPFPRDTIDDWPTAQWTFELLSLMRQSLVRLVIDIPLRSLYPAEDHLSVRPKLRAAFEQLQNLEEFTSTRDELFLATHEPGSLLALRQPPVWRAWSNLRRLALYNESHDSPDFYDSLHELPHLECIALTRAEWPAAVAIWPRFAAKAQQHHLKVLSLDVEDGSWTITGCIDSPHWPRALQSVKASLGRELEICPIEIPLPFYCKPGDATDLCQQWVRDRAITGDLWHLTAPIPFLSTSD